MEGSGLVVCSRLFFDCAKSKQRLPEALPLGGLGLGLRVEGLGFKTAMDTGFGFSGDGSGHMLSSFG